MARWSDTNCQLYHKAAGDVLQKTRSLLILLLHGAIIPSHSVAAQQVCRWSTQSQRQAQWDSSSVVNAFRSIQFWMLNSDVRTSVLFRAPRLWTVEAVVSNSQ